VGFARLRKDQNKYTLVNFDESMECDMHPGEPYVWDGEILCVPVGTELAEYCIGDTFTKDEVSNLAGALPLQEIELRW